MKQPKEIEELFFAALELPGGERQIFIDRTCAGNPELKQRLNSLLAADQVAEDKGLNKPVIKQSAKKFADDLLADHWIGKIVGQYKILERIGTGGMGAVYRVTRSDGQIEKQAALKIIKRGMDTEAIIRRFLRERQILANLEHPNIARLLDAGMTGDGLPFLVMEYVDGISIDSFTQTNRLDLKERLKLFGNVCAAVTYAHQNLIIHRDLKPSNILVTKDGEPKLLDFGIAKLLKPDEESTQTEAAMRILTPDYASPEQLRGENITTASDVYSLGVILYELLTDRPPHSFQGKELGEIIRAVSESTPIKPSSVISAQLKAQNSKLTKTDNQSETPNNQVSKFQSANLKALRGDVDNIVLKALQREPDRRYSSVEKLAEDIERYLDNRPVTARGDSLKYRSGKFIQRNKLGAAAAVLIFLTLFGGIIATLWEARRAERQSQLAEQRFNDVRTMADSFLFEFHDAIHNLPGATPARKLIVQRALEYLAKLDQESAGDASLERELASAYEKVGQIQGNSYFSNLGDTDGAMKSYQRSLELRRKLAEADAGNSGLQKELSDSYEGVGDMFYTLSDLNSGLQNYQNSLAIREKIAGAEPNNLDYQANLGDIYAKVGDIEGMEGLPNLGDTFGSLENYQKSVAIDKKLTETAPDKAEYKINYAQKLSKLGNLYRIVGKTADSIVTFQTADQIFQSIIAATPDDFSPKINQLINNAFLRYSLVDDERYDEAVDLVKQTIKMLEEMQTADPKNSFVRRSLGVSCNSLSRTQLLKGEVDQALENSGQALKLAEELAASDASSTEKAEDLADTLQFLAEAEFQKKDFAAARSSYRRAIEIHQKTLEANSSNIRTRINLAICRAGIGRVEAAEGNFSTAIEDFQAAIPILEEAAQKSPVNVSFRSRLALKYLEFGEVYQKSALDNSSGSRENQAEAQKWFQKSADIWNRMQKDGVLNKTDARHFQDVSNLLSK